MGSFVDWTLLGLIPTFYDFFLRTNEILEYVEYSETKATEHYLVV